VRELLRSSALLRSMAGLPSGEKVMTTYGRWAEGQKNEVAELKAKVAALDSQVSALTDALKSHDLVIFALRVRLDEIKEWNQLQDYLKARGE